MSEPPEQYPIPPDSMIGYMIDENARAQAKRDRQVGEAVRVIEGTGGILSLERFPNGVWAESYAGRDNLTYQASGVAFSEALIELSQKITKERTQNANEQAGE